MSTFLTIASLVTLCLITAAIAMMKLGALIVETIHRTQNDSVQGSSAEAGHWGGKRRDWRMMDAHFACLAGEVEHTVRIFWIVRWPLIGKCLLPAWPEHTVTPTPDPHEASRFLLIVAWFHGRFPCEMIIFSNHSLHQQGHAPHARKHAHIVCEPSPLQTRFGI